MSFQLLSKVWTVFRNKFVSKRTINESNGRAAANIGVLDGLSSLNTTSTGMANQSSIALTRCVVLTSSTTPFIVQKAQIRDVKQLLAANDYCFTEIDCSLSTNTSMRERFFAVSGVRGQFPQVFLTSEDGKTIHYIGSFEEIEKLNEMNDLPAEYTKMHGIASLSIVFADVPRADRK